jgi:hypothetical protein
MAFTVQDSNGSVAGANAYIDVAFFNTYHTDRNVTDVVDGNFETAAIQAAIILATDFIDSRYQFVGDRKSRDQTTEWPRFDAEDRDEYLVFGIPHQVEEACAELALAELNSAGSLFPTIPTDASGRQIKSQSSKLDVLESSVEYFGGDSGAASTRPPIFYTADWRLRRSGLVESSRRIARG